MFYWRSLSLNLEVILAALKSQVKKIQDGRLKLPPEVPYVEPHNTWVVNHPGTLLVIPVGDLAQHVLLNLCYMLQIDTFGKFPGTVPSIFLITYLQAHHLDLDFYDKFYKPGAYLPTHTAHMDRGHFHESG